MKMIRWRNVVLPGESWHLARMTASPRVPVLRHTHDFAEVFWIEEGQGLHFLNGREELISAGMVIFLRPEDVHGLRAAADGGAFTFVNFAVSTPMAEDFSRRWAGYGLAQVPWKAGPPKCWMVQAGTIAVLKGLVAEMMNKPPVPLIADYFLSAFLSELHRQPNPFHQLKADAPEWLRRAIGEFSKTDALPPGLEDFFRLAGRSREHVTRVCRQQTGLTPGELVTSIRLEYAARYLERSDLSVTEVAEVAGFGNLSVFHRHFREATGLTPLHYRRGRRSALPVA